MNILLWAFRIALAFWNITGATYMMSNHDSLANTWAMNTLPSYFWIILGALQIVLSIGLIIPDKIKLLRNQTTIFAAGLSVISLIGLGVYSAYVGAGIFWALIPAGMAAFVAYKKYK